MGTPTRTDRVLSEAADKVAKAEEAARQYEAQLSEAAFKKRQLEEENEKLRASILNMALQNASVDLRREHVQLRQTLDSYQTKIDQMREISLLSAKVVDSRIKTKQGRQYVEYKLQIVTDVRGTLVLWHRYSTFLCMFFRVLTQVSIIYRNLAATLKAKNPSSDHDIPELQTQSLTGFFSDQLIIDRIAKLNEFLDVVTKADEFQWGIRIDKDTCVYKRKSKRTDRLYSVGSRESISTLTPSMRDSMFMPMSSRASTISMDSY
ncbi:hypothetical protein KXD40_002965 [Peronospora effusa]|uniref:PX domain-containing protein n=1 Tax=Peronospora effusa TaxID=542832 RepID=A0A3M6VRA3_9STRA|nr:hypothetical protein DD238_003136 [Peronospora effusa]RQM14734.1 hypothetical protein DD237_002168 [Peronospora effusa]UIZ29947.1 hypothetical protein KXD40_002965 [Peronospora effusa]